MSEAASAITRGDGQIRANRPPYRLAYSLGALFSVLTAFCLYQAYRANQQILQRYTPAPPAEYDLHVEPYQFTDADFVHPIDPRPVATRLQQRVQEMESLIADLRSRGQSARAVELRSRLDNILASHSSEWAAATLRALDSLHDDATREERNKLAQALVSQAFPELSYAPGRDRFDLHASFAVHSIFGPYASTLRPIEKSTVSFAVDPRGPSLFGFDWREAEGVVTIDPEAGRVAPWPIADLKVQAHYDSCLAFDTRRQRLLIWGRDLLAVDVLKKQPVLVRKGNPSICALTYSHDDDRLYALCRTWSGGSSEPQMSEVRTYNCRGAELSRVTLSIPIPGPRMPMISSSTKLALVGGKLLVMPVGSDDKNGQFILSSTNYVFDPHSGKLLFACRRQPR